MRARGFDQSLLGIVYARLANAEANRGVNDDDDGPQGAAFVDDGVDQRRRDDDIGRDHRQLE